MSETTRPLMALLFAQFSAYHVDRCEAVARRMGERFDVLAVEVATQSTTYAWAPSGGVAGARKVTLFPDRNYDQIGGWRRFLAQFKVLRRCRIVLVGVGYNQPDIIALSWVLRLIGVKVVALSESKFDDVPRRAGFELAKAFVLLAYRAAIVGGRRQRDYFRFLGFRRRTILPGYDTVDLARVRSQASAEATGSGMPHRDRGFVFVGRLVAKKNLSDLMLGYAEYCRGAGSSARRLTLVGSGPEEAPLREMIAAHDLAAQVDLPGFLDAPQVAAVLSCSLALILPSAVEQWGLVVNEALAFGLPVIASTQVGARDVLVRNLVNGFIIEPGSSSGLARAMAALADDAALWQAMSDASHQRAWLGDTERLADAVEVLVDPAAHPAASRIAAFEAAMDCPFSNAALGAPGTWI